MVLIILFSQYLRLIPIPVPTYSKTRKLHTSKLYIFQIMPVCSKLLLLINAFLFGAVIPVVMMILTLVLILDIF